MYESRAEINERLAGVRALAREYFKRARLYRAEARAFSENGRMRQQSYLLSRTFRKCANDLRKWLKAQLRCHYETVGGFNVAMTSDCIHTSTEYQKSRIKNQVSV